MTERVDFIFYGGMYRNAALDPIGKMIPTTGGTEHFIQDIYGELFFLLLLLLVLWRAFLLLPELLEFLLFFIFPGF